MVHDVFISYAFEDKEYVDMVCAGLEQRGLTCWIAPRDIPPGAKWPPTITAAIKNARAFV